ncbi:hypothetical protein MTO96_044647, partial [Rhipicephalus appendiculatus]
KVTARTFRFFERLLIQGTPPTAALETGCVARLAKSVVARQQHGALWNHAAEATHTRTVHFVDKASRSPIDTSDAVVAETVHSSDIRHGGVNSDVAASLAHKSGLAVSRLSLLGRPMHFGCRSNRDR